MRFGRGVRWTEVLAGRLSPFAVETLDRDEVRQEAGVLRDPERLQEMLLDMGLPVFPAVLDYERVVGSVIETILLFQEGVRGRKPLTLEAPPIVEGRRLIAVGIWWDPLHEEDEDGLVDYFLDERGTIYHGTRTEPIRMAESYVVQIEQEAWDIVRNELVWTRKPSPWRHVLEVSNVNFAAPVAAALGVPVMPGATDRYRGVWQNSDMYITNRFSRFGTRSTSLDVGPPEAVMRAFRAIYEIQPQACAVWHGESEGAPSDGERIVDRLPLYGYHKEDRGELRLIDGCRGPRLQCRMD